MFESVTFESILQRMLDRISANMDKREGSIIYDALAPAAVELQNLYIELDVILKESFADTATMPYLIRRARERGIAPFSATPAILKAECLPKDCDVPIGTRFSLNTLNYKVTEKIADGTYKVECETLGAIGNSYFGDMIPIDYVQGLVMMSCTELLIPAEDDETLEAFRERYFKNIMSQAYGGNIADYKEKTMQINGVGGVKVKPTWNGGGTVKIIFNDSTYAKPSNELVDLVQNTLDPVGHSGKGYGVAPIGHIVTVEGVGEVVINVDTEIVYETDWTWEDCEIGIRQAVDSYLQELRESWMDEEFIIVRISQLEAKILNVNGILDISGTTLNGSTKNLYLAENEIPVRGGINGN